MPHRTPVDACRLHRDMGSALLGQPRQELHKPLGRCLERLHLAADGAVTGQADTGDHALLVNVQAGAPLVNNVHGRLSSPTAAGDRKSTRLNSSHLVISYAVFCLKKKKTT